MNIYLYDACYLLTNIFDTYIIYLFMKLFFKNNFINKKAAISAYTLYYVVTSPVYLFYSVALVNFTVTLLLIFIITLCYKSKISKKIIVAILNQLTFFICEAIVAGFLGVTNIDPLQNTYYGDAFSLIMVELLAFVFIKIIGQFKQLRFDAVDIFYYCCFGFGYFCCL